MYDQTEDCSINPSIAATQYSQIDAPTDNSSASIPTFKDRDESGQGLPENEVNGSTTPSPSSTVPDVKIDKPKNTTRRDIKADK
jgi:hypothetical protein